MTTQQSVDLRMVRDVAAEINPSIEVTFEGGEFTLRLGRTVESYAEAVDAVSALRASWES